MKLDYEKDMYIDHMALDVEWLEQGQVALRYGQYWSTCQDELTRAEENVKVVRSELKLEAYEDPESTLGKGIKPTGDAVEAWYRIHPDHIAAKERWMAAKKAADDAYIAYQQISGTRKNQLNKLLFFNLLTPPTRLYLSLK